MYNVACQKRILFNFPFSLQFLSGKNIIGAATPFFQYINIQNVLVLDKFRRRFGFALPYLDLSNPPHKYFMLRVLYINMLGDGTILYILAEHHSSPDQNNVFVVFGTPASRYVVHLENTPN